MLNLAKPNSVIVNRDYGPTLNTSQNKTESTPIVNYAMKNIAVNQLDKLKGQGGTSFSHTVVTNSLIMDRRALVLCVTERIS